MIPLNNIKEVLDLIPVPYLIVKADTSGFHVLHINHAYKKMASHAGGSASLADNLPFTDPYFHNKFHKSISEACNTQSNTSFEYETIEAGHQVTITYTPAYLLIGFIKQPVKYSEIAAPLMRDYEFLDTMMEGCQLISFDWTYLFINEAAAKQGRLPKSEYIGKTMFNLYPLLEGSPLHHVLERSMNERIIQKKLNQFAYPDGTTGWFELNIYPSEEGIFILSLDITERKKSEEKLIRSEHKYKVLTENTTDIVLILSGNLKHVYRSPSALKKTGWTDEEIGQTNLRELIHKEDRHILDETHKLLLAYPRQPIPVSVRVLHKKGHYITLEGFVNNLLDDELINGIVVNVWDVTANKRSEESLIRNERELKQVQEIARMGYVHFDLIGNTSFGSDEMHRICETNKNSFHFTLENFLKLIHQNDKKRFEEFLLKLFAGFANHEIEYRLQTASGKVKHIFQRTELEMKEGKVVALNGILLNITEKRSTENALTESNEKFRKLFNSSPLPQWLFDSETLQFIDVNDAAIHSYGYTRDEFLSMTIEDIRPSSDILKLAGRRKKPVQPAEEMNSRSFVHQKKNGALIHVDIQSAHVIINGKNARIVIARDITAELAFEKQLIQSNERYNLVLEATNESIIDWDIVNDVTIWGKGFEKNFGYDTSAHNNYLWSNNIHPNDRERVLTSLEETLKDSSKRYFDAEFAFLKANREVAYVQHRGIILRNTRGKAIRAIGAMIDVTELKEKISEIERHNQNLRNIAWTQSHIVRAPLARMIGLVKLLENTDASCPDAGELSKILSYIVTSAYELDEIIKDIVKKTETLQS